MNYLALLSDNIYWNIIPNVVYTEFKNDSSKLFAYATRIFQAGYRNYLLFYKYIKQLLALDDMIRARELIITVEGLDRNGTDANPIKFPNPWSRSNRHRDMTLLEFSKTLFAKASSDRNMHLLGLCKLLFEKYASNNFNSAECRWFYAKTLMYLNDIKRAVDEFQNLTHYNNVNSNHNIHWKSCIEFGNLLTRINGTEAVWASRQNPFLWALNRIKYYKAETTRCPFMDGRGYYKRRFNWIKHRVDQQTFIRLLNELCNRFPHDNDAAEIREKHLIEMGIK